MSGIQTTECKKIFENIASVFGCGEEDITGFNRVNEGLNNVSFTFSVKGADYVYRHPGDGTEKLVNRKNEKNSLELMKEWGIDPTYVYMNEEEGWKISCFVRSFREPDYESEEDSKKVTAMLRRLHALPIKTEYGLNPWEDAKELEKLAEEKAPGFMEKHRELREKIGELYRRTIGDGVEKCFCHGDTYRHNWMIKEDGEVILIDWEYAGYSDPGVDVGYYIIDAMYDFDEAEKFIVEYLSEKDEVKLFHFMAYSAIIAYYWFVWAVYREACGACLGGALEQWRDMAYKFAEILHK